MEDSLRNQLADWLESRDSSWDRVSREAYLEEADALLARFDVRLREPQAEPFVRLTAMDPTARLDLYRVRIEGRIRVEGNFAVGSSINECFFDGAVHPSEVLPGVPFVEVSPRSLLARTTSRGDTVTDDATADERGMGPEPREWECGPYCALCGQCRACTESGVQPDYGCYDRVEVDGSRAHLWNAAGE